MHFLKSTDLSQDEDDPLPSDLWPLEPLKPASEHADPSSLHGNWPDKFAKKEMKCQPQYQLSEYNYSTKHNPLPTASVSCLFERD